MDSNRGYNEPELQKMAAFLRERCDKGQYGLTYLDAQKNLIRIPWPTVPRQNEDIPENFNMFTEWAYLSFRKRGNRGEQLENEALSAQKHRFRNALARADGLRQSKELSTETIRVYEFVDTRKERDRGENVVQRQERKSPPNYRVPEPMTQPTYTGVLPGDLSDPNEIGSEWDPCSPITITSSPNQTPVFVNAGAFQLPPDEVHQAPLQDDPTLSSLLDEMMHTPPPSVGTYQQNNSGYHQTTYTVPETVRPDDTMAAALMPNYQVVHANHVPRYIANGQANGVMSQNRQPEHRLLIKVAFRGEDVKQVPVMNGGFRLYSGSNVPDMRRLLDGEQRDQLQRLTKYDCDHLFGPESLEQVEMPSLRLLPDTHRTKQIIDNMDRGIVFCLEYPPDDGVLYNSAGIPNVYSIRLCQTRVFPYDTNVGNRVQLEEEGLKRMSWMKIFDGSEFMRQMQRWVSLSGPMPSSTINLSVGQKPKRDSTDRNLVSVTVSITSAKLVVEKYFEEQMIEICISDKNSMDNAAQDLKSRIQARISVDDSVY